VREIKCERARDRREGASEREGGRKIDRERDVRVRADEESRWTQLDPSAPVHL